MIRRFFRYKPATARVTALILIPLGIFFLMLPSNGSGMAQVAAWFTFCGLVFGMRIGWPK